MRITLENWTPLLFAVSEKREETVKVLLAAGANVNVRGRKTVQAVEQKNRHEEPVVKDMLLVATGWTPLMEAAERESIQLVQLLLAAGADKNARTEEGITAAGVAQKTGNREIIELLK
jgi:ankyrin repeat protein